MLSEDVSDLVELGPGGRPFTYGLDGTPVTLSEAAKLYADFDKRTVHKTRILLPSGTPAVVRTLCLVFDDEAATGRVPEDHVPQVFGSAVYRESDNQFLRGLWTYGSAAEAKAGHPEAVWEFESGRASVSA